MPVRLIALDLDDTLLSPDLSISPDNAAAVREALDAGIATILASGRTIASMRPYAASLGMLGRGLPIVCVNGAEIRDVDSSAIIRRLVLPEDACALVTEELASHGLPVQAYDDDCIVVTEPNAWTDRDSALTGLPSRVAVDRRELSERPRSKLLSAGDPARIAELAPLLRERLDGIAEIVISKPYFLEVLPAGADKGEALAWVAAARGVPREEVMAVGDAGNDVGMVSWAGLGCAPADAREEVLAIARHVSPRAHDRDAVAELIRRLALARS